MPNKLTLLTSLPLLILIILFILLSAAANFHSQLLKYAQNNWDNYSTLRDEPSQPDCNLDEQQTTPPPKNAEDDLDELFGDTDDAPSDEALQAAKQLCKQKWDAYNLILEKRNDKSLLRFINFETQVAKIVQHSTDNGRHFLVLLFALAALATTIFRKHLSLRTPLTTLDDRISNAAQLIANLVIVFSFYAFYTRDLQSGVEHISTLPLYWIVAFSLMALTNIIQLFIPLKNPEKSNLTHATLSIPLYAYMSIIAALYFYIIEKHPAGMAIYIDQITEHAVLYINVALYVFAGMMLKNTQIADKFFALLRPWKFSPEILIFLIVIASALPTAYSGASGIFVIAAGAIIYKELRASNIRRTLAQATTAMSGSMGIILNPCLLVVIIAALNKEVTTDQLFHAGAWVFLVNIVVFIIVITASRTEKLSIENPKIALPQMLQATLPLLPYIAISATLILIFKFALSTNFDEYTAPILLPLILLCLLIYDRIYEKIKYNRQLTSTTEDPSQNSEQPIEKPNGIFSSLLSSTSSTSIHAGGLLALMSLSICIGGIISRAELSTLLPQDFASPFTAMLLLFFILVFIGMIMDPYGAVILVSASLTQIAYANGINPVHFWLTVLCAFELGYLTPPVALNHLLTRQIIGESEFIPHEHKSFWYRHERILFPITIKAIVLILVAFVPLLKIF